MQRTVDITRRIGYADGEISREGEAVLAKIERILGLHQPAAATAKAAAKRRAREVAR